MNYQIYMCNFIESIEKIKTFKNLLARQVMYPTQLEHFYMIVKDQIKN